MTANPSVASLRCWKGERTTEIRRDHLDRLLEGKIAYLRVPRFLEPSWCAEITCRLLRSDPPVLEAQDNEKYLLLGLNFPARSTKNEAYFSRVESVARTIRQIYADGEDPILKAQHTLVDVTGWKMQEARENGLPYLTDMIVAFYPGSKTPIHRDDKYTHNNDYFISKFARQLSCNVYLSVCAKGGSLAIYRRRYDSKDPAYDYDFRPDWTMEVQGAQLRPRVGDLILFDPGYYHEVKEIVGPDYRISGHSFIGINPANGTMTYWV